MSEPDRGRGLVATIALLGVLVLVVGGVAPTVTADSHENGTDPYVIEQGDQCVDVTPVVNESQSVEAFYDYRHPDSEPNATTYSSHGTTAYQADNTSILVLYRGSEGTSLVIVHEALHQPASEGTNGSSATFTVTGLSPDDDGWVVEDDDYDAQDDRFDHFGTYSEIDWVWAQGRTDGAAYRGLDRDVEIGIEPAFNESADLRYGGHYAGYVHDWQVITATDGGFERVSLDSLSENVTVRDGYCAAAPNASLAVDDPEPEVGNTTVTLDASNSTSPTGVEEYRWDLTGNGSAERVTGEPTIEHVFETTGEREVTVTIVAGDGQTDAAAVTVDVTDETPPTPRIDAPSAATVDETITISGADSTDNHRIASYELSLGDGTTASGATVNHSYGSPGEYDVTLTVTDPAGLAATANATVEVTLGGPNATLDVPGSVTVNESVTLDASGSEVSSNATYEWTVDGETLNVTNDSTYETSFATTGARDVGVIVSDDGGSDSASATIDVHEQLNASLAAEPANVSAGDPVTFDASASTGNVTRYEWAFGDGTTIEGEEATVEHEYVEPGSYEAELTVVDGEGSTDTATTTVVVTESDGPVAQLDAPDSVAVNESVTLDASASDALENATFEWVVDGTTVNESTSPTYETTFETTGERAVAVVVSDANGSDDASTTITVTNGSDGGDGSGGDDGSDDGDDGSGGNGGGGGSGGAGTVPVPQPDPVETSVAIEDGTVVVIAENVDAGQSFSVDLPANTTLGTLASRNAGSPNGSRADAAGRNNSEPTAGGPTATGSNGTGGNASGPAAAGPTDTGSNATADDVVALRSIEVTPAAHADTIRIRFNAADRDVPGRFTVASAIVPNASAPVRSVSYEFAVDRAAMTAAGVSADDLTGHARADDGSWRAVRTATAVDGDRIVATATAAADGVLGVGAEGPVLFVRDVATTGPATNETVGLAATVRNSGSEPLEETLAVDRDGERLASLPVALAPGEGTTWETTVPVASDRGGVGANDGAPVGDGAHVTVGGRSWGLAVVHVAALSPSPSAPGPNETAAVRAELVNRGAAGEVDLPLRVGDEVVTTRTVSLAPGERRTVRLAYRTPEPGSYPVAVGDANATVEVSERERFTGGDSERTESALPGFGVLVALLVLAGLLSAGAVGYRRRRG